MKRREFIKKATLTTAGAFVAPYILPSGRLFAPTGARKANHVVFVLFGGGIRNQESVGQKYLLDQGRPSSGNIMNNMLTGAAPTSNIVYNPWAPIVSSSLQSQGVLFKEMRYTTGPTGHYNGHTVAMTGNYTATGLNLNVNPADPTIFEYYRKHNSPAQTALNAWWLSEGLGPYPSLNYSQHENYGASYGANYLCPSNFITGTSLNNFNNASAYQPDDVTRIEKMKGFFDANFDKSADDLPGVINSREDKEKIKKMLLGTLNNLSSLSLPLPTGVSTNELNTDLLNIATSWKVLETFKPELTVINTFNLDVCHSNFTGYIENLHKADYGIGWLWDKIQSTPGLANDTILICMPEHGRNASPNSLVDANGLRAYDHSSDQNSREIFSLMVGPPSVVKQNVNFGTPTSPVGESIDIVPTIAHILGFDTSIPAGMLPGRVLTEAFI
ncbi:MAG: hypothetical protein ACPGVD_01995 [Flavobacteriales bacterium]